MLSTLQKLASAAPLQTSILPDTEFDGERSTVTKES